uniref:Uncharacterized protein n=1 Tax=Timema shepardi TaxID=629360 RepID=A0A7R9BBI7_TIMSH|nr:unnamed protein product [Timema shepardi]
MCGQVGDPEMSSVPVSKQPLDDFERGGPRGSPFPVRPLGRHWRTRPATNRVERERVSGVCHRSAESDLAETLAGPCPLHQGPHTRGFTGDLVHRCPRNSLTVS